MAKKTWCVPELTDEFRERMEDVLDQYEKPLDPEEPVICLDEQPYQMVDDAWAPEQAQPGKIAKQDYEYRRCGTCSVFVAVEPKAGKRLVQAKRLMDNLNTHNEKSLIETFGEAQAKLLLDRIEWHYTPKHASWLNLAEIEISALAKQCLDRRLSTIELVQYEASHWSRDRNRKKIKINWTFNRKDAKRVFPKLYRKRLAG